MKRLHVHVGVHDLEQSVRFYSALFAMQPTVKKDDSIPTFGADTRNKAAEQQPQAKTACCG